MGSLFISVDDTIPVNGYLVAWQYYLRKIGVHGCSKTAVTVWRLMGGKYNLIEQTILTPANFTNQGPRFQYVHNQVIRVKKGDHLGTYSTNSSCWNVISVNKFTGRTGKPTGWKRYDSNFSKGDKEVSASHLNKERRHLALRAFVAGVLFDIRNCM